MSVAYIGLGWEQRGLGRLKLAQR